MGDSLRKAPVAHLALAMFSNPWEEGRPGISRWDISFICDYNHAHKKKGRAQLANYLYVPVQGWDVNYLSQLTQPIYLPHVPRWHIVDAEELENYEIYMARRYCILEETLSDILSIFDSNRSLDLGDYYQPFMPVQPRLAGRGTPDGWLDGMHADIRNPLDLGQGGVIFDKQTQSHVME